jgi:hypothetical protein
LFYPLNYGNNDIVDFSFPIADCKQRESPTNSFLPGFLIQFYFFWIVDGTSDWLGLFDSPNV